MKSVPEGALAEIRREIIDMSLSVGALAVSVETPFLWASGYRMPVYNDNRRLLSFPAARQLVRDGFLELIASGALAWDGIAGTASAGIAPATTLADALAAPLYYVRSGAKDHGMGRVVEGAPPEGLAGHRIVLVEDLVSAGGSSAHAAEALATAGATVTACLALFSYGFAAAGERFAALPGAPPLVPLCTMSDLIARGTTSGAIPERDARALEEWIADPFGWGAHRGWPRELKEE
ncbi:MAG: phosphoribosyltransferase family protein [Spirochaeta sp.]|jgi:orotate phosphoribosyltransferase|nr:phosphoribosyltransferase family protein [Spirochaeta sp.]